MALRLIQFYAVYNDAAEDVVEVDKGVVTPPTPGTETWWRTAVREAVYVLRERELVQYVWETVNWTSLSVRKFLQTGGWHVRRCAYLQQALLCPAPSRPPMYARETPLEAYMSYLSTLANLP